METIEDSPVTHYGLSWVGKYDPELVIDSWQAQRNGLTATICDLGGYAILLVTNTRTSEQVAGHRFGTMKGAALAAANLLGATWF